MGIEQKVRSLFCGLPAGLNFKEMAGTPVLLFTAVPYELEDVIANWIMALPEDLHRDALYFVSDRPVALTQPGWDAFISWMLKALQDTQACSNFAEVASETARKSLR